MRVVVESVKGHQMRCQGPSGHEFFTDNPDGEGQSTGPSPVEMLVASLGACALVDVVEILGKMRQGPPPVRVEMDAHRAADAPRRLVCVDLRFIAGGDVEQTKLERAVDLSLEKYCSVRSSLDPAVELNVVCEVELPS